MRAIRWPISSCAERTPDVYLLDGDRRVRYRGMIDNQYGVGYARPTATSNYMLDALDEVLAGKPVTRPTTEPVGCFIGLCMGGPR